MSKITIPTEVWVKLYAELAGWHVEKHYEHNDDHDSDGNYIVPWTKDENGDESYTEEAQDKFNDASGSVEEILGRFFEREES